MIQCIKYFHELGNQKLLELQQCNKPLSSHITNMYYNNIDNYTIKFLLDDVPIKINCFKNDCRSQLFIGTIMIVDDSEISPYCEIDNGNWCSFKEYRDYITDKKAFDSLCKKYNMERFEFLKAIIDIAEFINN